MDIVGAIFIRIEDRGRLVRKLVNMPDGMLSISRTTNYHIVEPYFDCGLFWSLKRGLEDGRVLSMRSCHVWKDTDLETKTT